MAKEPTQLPGGGIVADWWVQHEEIAHLKGRVYELELAMKGEVETRRYTERKLQIAVNALNEIKRLADLGRIN